MEHLNRKILGISIISLGAIMLILLVFVKAAIDERDAFLCEAVHSNPNIEATRCPAHQSDLSWLISSAFGIGFLILGIGVYSLFVPVKTIKQGFKEIDMSKLSEDEKKIIELLKANEGSSYQSDLIRETGFSKVQITRILDRLELNGIVERKRRGMTNIVVLK